MAAPADTAATAAASAVAARGSELSLDALPRQRKWVVVRRFADNKLAVAGLVTIVLLYAAAIAAPVISRYPYDEIYPGMRSKPPSAEHWLGTDRNGRDVYARLVKGGQVSLAAGFASVVIIMTVGVLIGAAAGFFGGWVDALTMRFTDILLSVPLILLLITAASLFKPGLLTTVVVIGLSSWPGAARLVRGQFLALKEQVSVGLARGGIALGAKTAQWSQKQTPVARHRLRARAR